MSIFFIEDKNGDFFSTDKKRRYRKLTDSLEATEVKADTFTKQQQRRNTEKRFLLRYENKNKRKPERTKGTSNMFRIARNFLRDKLYLCTIQKYQMKNLRLKKLS